jgi:hypothetical protein
VILASSVAPKVDRATDGSRFEHSAITWCAGFVIFLRGSGLRLLTLYPDTLWRTGLVGIIAFLGWIAIDPSSTCVEVR